MIEIPLGATIEQESVQAEQVATAIGLATNEVDVVVSVTGIGPRGPRGLKGDPITAFVQEDAPDPEIETLDAGDIWIKKPPLAMPQPTFIWDGEAWLPIYGEAAVSGNYEYHQSDPQAHWEISHLLHYEPSIRVVETGGHTVRGTVTFLDNDNLTIDFSEPIAGTAYLS
jgi:hypothetical protein